MRWLPKSPPLRCEGMFKVKPPGLLLLTKQQNIRAIDVKSGS